MKEEHLEGIGLSRNESKVYLTLLRLGSSSAGEITDESGVHRRNVYDALERLSKKGLVGHIIKGRIRYYAAASPNSLLDMIDEEKNSLEEKTKIIKNMMPELMLVHGAKVRENVIIFKGAKGVKTILEDILKTKKTNHVLGAHKPPSQIISYLENFHRRRVRLGIKDLMIFERGDDERANSLSKMPLTEIRILPVETSSNTAINIYGGKVAILMWSEPVGILIDNKEVANIFRTYFKIIWKGLKTFDS